MSSKNLIKWLVNFTLLGLFAATYFLDLTGVNLHQWLGLVVGAFVIFHLINHWQWVKAITQRFFQNASGASRINYLLDATLGLGIFSIIFSGVIISTWLNVSGALFANVRLLHVIMSISTLGILLVKLIFHWKCIAGAFRQFFIPKKILATQANMNQECENASLITRREALRTVGTISLAGALVMIRAISSLDFLNLKNSEKASNTIPANESAVNSAAINLNTPTLQPTTNSPLPLPNAQSSSNCTVLCPNGCSYPGRCRRYVDNNNNGKCDLGECL